MTGAARPTHVAPSAVLSPRTFPWPRAHTCSRALLAAACRLLTVCSYVSAQCKRRETIAPGRLKRVANIIDALCYGTSGLSPSAEVLLRSRYKLCRLIIMLIRSVYCDCTIRRPRTVVQRVSWCGVVLHSDWFKGEKLRSLSFRMEVVYRYILPISNT